MCDILNILLIKPQLLVINHSISIKWSWVRFYASRGHFQITKWLPDHNDGLDWSKTFKITQHFSLSVLTGALIAVTSVTNDFIFIKWSYIFLGTNRGCPVHKVAPRPQKWPELTKKRPKALNCFSFSALTGTRQLLDQQPTNLILLNDYKYICNDCWPQNGFSRQQGSFKSAKAAWIGQKKPEIP